MKIFGQKPLIGTPLNKRHPLAKGLVGCWLMNEGAGTQVVDLSGHNHTGILQTGTSWFPGKLGTSIDFNGSTGFIEIADHDDFTPALMPFSISAWVYMNDATLFPIVTKGKYNVNGEWTLWSHSDDVLRFRVYDESVANCLIGKTAGKVDIYEDQWLNIVATYDGGTLSSGINIYLNGVLIGSDYENNPGSFVAIENLTGPVWIGRYDTNYANGLIDNMVMWRKELSPFEIRQSFISPFCMFERKLISLYAGAMGEAGWSTTITEDIGVTIG